MDPSPPGVRSRTGTVPFAIAVLFVWLSSVGNARAQATIDITGIPTYGVNGVVTGLVGGVDFATHRVVTYIQIEGSGWWIKPTSLAPTVTIDAGGNFTVDVASGGLDNRATIFCVALIADSVAPPDALGTPRVPATLTPLALDCEERYSRTFSFANRIWGVKEAHLPVGPGSNRFSNHTDDVFVDAQGHLHLWLRFRDGAWRSSEVILLESLGHGSYAFRTASRLDTLDANAVFGAFTWDSFGDETTVPGGLHREIDNEDSRWGNAADLNSSQFVVQPFGGSEFNLRRYALPDLSSDPALTRLIVWQAQSIHWLALQGMQPISGYPLGSLIGQYSYTHAPAEGRYVPTPGRERFRFNLWLLAAAPAEGSAIEVVITDFEFAASAPQIPVASDAGLLLLFGSLVAGGWTLIRRLA